MKKGLYGKVIRATRILNAYFKSKLKIEHHRIWNSYYFLQLKSVFDTGKEWIYFLHLFSFKTHILNKNYLITKGLIFPRKYFDSIIIIY